MKKAIQIGFILLFTVNISFAQSKKGGPLDKKTFTCEFIEEGKKKAEPVKDDLKFTGGKFQCKILLNEGFKATVYEFSIDSTDSSMPLTFWADIPGEKDEIFKWTATVTGDEIEGTATLFKKEKVKKRYNFSGTIKGKKVKKD